MQQRYFILLLFILLGCNKDNRGITFSIQLNAEAVIPSSTGINLPINLISPDLTTQSNSSFEANQTTPSLVREILLKVNIKSPPQTSFDFLKSVRIYMRADGLAEKEIAYLENIPTGGLRSILLNTDETTNFKDFIVQESINLRVQATTRQIVTSDTELELLPRFEVRASLLE